MAKRHRTSVQPLEPRRLLASISGSVFYDLNLDGAQQPGDVPLPGWVVFADSNNNGVVDGVTNSYSNTTASQPINDLSTFTVPITVANFSGTVADVDVRINLAHSYLVDLDIVLISPLGTRITLTTDNGTGGQNFSNTIFDDDASQKILGAQSTTSYNARYRPETTLGTLNGEAINGTWKLEVTDDSHVDTGTFYDWGLTIRNGEPDATTFSDGSYQIQFAAGGTYPIKPILQSGYASSPTVRSINVSPTTLNPTGADFGVRLPSATISGKVFGDVDNSGTLNGSETGIAGRTVFIDADDNGQLDAGEISTTTDASGNYSFAGLRPQQTYKVRTVLPYGWSQSAPAGTALVASSAPMTSASVSAIGVAPTKKVSARGGGDAVMVMVANRAKMNATLAKPANRVLRSIANVSLARSLGKSAAGELFLVPLGNDADAAKIAARIATLAGIAWASPNYVYGTPATADPREYTPNDPQFGQQTFHTRIGDPAAWDLSEGAGIKVGVIDDGVLTYHPDLTPNLWFNPGEIANNGKDDDGNGYIDDVNGWDFTNSTSVGTGDNNPNPENGDTHGTHLAGIIAARTNNGTNVSGVAGKATIVPIRFFGTGVWTSAVIYNAFKYAADIGCKVVNVSYDVDQFASDPTYLAAVDYLYSHNVLMISSAGNSNELDAARAKIDGTIYVASVDANDRKLSDANFGAGVDLSAPGESMLSTTNNAASASTGSMGGSSVASAVASGTAALIWARHPTWTRDQVAAQLIGTTTSIDAINPNFVGLLGSGRVSSVNALTQTLAAPRIGTITGLPASGATVVVAPTSIRIAVPAVLDPTAANTAGNWQLTSAGRDGVFGTADDLAIALTRTSGTYRIAANAITFDIGQSLTPGIYKFVAKSGASGLRSPFGTALDGNGDGTAGDDRTVTFTISARAASNSVTPPNGTTVSNTNFATRDSLAPIAIASADQYAAARRVTIDFSESITTPAAASVTLKNLTTNAIVPSSQYTTAYDATAKRFTLTINSGVLLANGNYRVTLLASGAKDAYGNSLSADATVDFFVLNGDLNRDRTVNFSDLLILAQHYGSPGTSAEGDATYDGTVNFDDLLQLAQNYGITLA